MKATLGVPLILVLAIPKCSIVQDEGQSEVTE